MLPEHPIQLQILTKLVRSESGLKYAEAKPSEDLGNDLYNYHLQQLVAKGYIAKQDQVYKLTSVGLIASNQIDSAGKEKTFIKASVLMGLVDLKQEQIMILNQKRTRHPLFGDIGIHAGTIKAGEKVVDAANRKFQEETGLVADFKFYGVRRKIMRFTNGRLLSDSFFHICFATEYQGDLIKENEFGENFWSPLGVAMEYESKTRTPNTQLLRIYRHLLTNKSFNGIELFHVEDELTADQIHQ